MCPPLADKFNLLDCFVTLAMKPSGTRRLRQGRSPQATHAKKQRHCERAQATRGNPVYFMLRAAHKI